jgi:hypothetical protein
METEQYEEAVRDYKKLTEVDASNRGKYQYSSCVCKKVRVLKRHDCL